jgi:hypothetical protein
MQYRQPIHCSQLISTMPSGRLYVAPTGHTGTQRRTVTLHAWARDETSRDIGVFTDLFLKDWSVNNARRQAVLGFAGDRTGRAADVLAQVDHHGPSTLLHRFLQRALQVALHAQQNGLIWPRWG